MCACSEKGTVRKEEKNKRGEGGLSDMSPFSRARKRDFADVALRRREAEGILADREERNSGDRKRGEKKGRKGGGSRAGRAQRGTEEQRGLAERVS